MIKSLKGKKKGFSLVELVVVMAIIGILLVVMAPNYKGFIDSAKNTAVQADARTLKTMLELYEVKFGNIPETTKVAEITTIPLSQSIEADNLVDFITNLKDDSPLKTQPVSSLGEIVKNGVPAPNPAP